MKDDSQLRLEMKILQLEDEISKLKKIIDVMASEIENSFSNQWIDSEFDSERGVSYARLADSYFNRTRIDELLNK